MSRPVCRCRRDGEWVDAKVPDLVCGDIVELVGGTVVPADGRLLGPGEPMLLDESSLTGEALAVAWGLLNCSSTTRGARGGQS